MKGNTVLLFEISLPVASSLNWLGVQKSGLLDSVKIAHWQLSNTSYVSDAVLGGIDIYLTFAISLYFHALHLDNKNNLFYKSIVMFK